MDPIETLHWLHGSLTNRLVIGPIMIAKMRAQVEKALMSMAYHEKLSAMQQHIVSAQQQQHQAQDDERPGKAALSVGDGPGEQDEPYGFNQPSPE